jgi:hypothetical protein
MTNTLTRTQARRWTLGAQLASALFVLAAVALGVVGLPEPRSDASLESTNTNPAANLPDAGSINNESTTDLANTTSQAVSIDTLGLAERLSLLKNAPAIVEKTPTTADPIDISTGKEDPTIDADGTIAKRVRYIGFINDPAKRHAFIRIDGKQRIVALGEVAAAGNPEFADLTLEKIMPQYIVLSDGQVRAQIKLATRVGQSITMAGGEKVDVAKAATNGSLLTAEDEANIAAMPPRQQPLARRRLERERRGLPPDKERRRPVAEPLGTARANFNGNRSNNRNNRNN